VHSQSQNKALTRIAEKMKKLLFSIKANNKTICKWYGKVIFTVHNYQSNDICIYDPLLLSFFLFKSAIIPTEITATTATFFISHSGLCSHCAFPPFSTKVLGK
jgi:hypothetical protein